MQWAIFVDKDRCVGCYACVVACKMEHNLPPYPVHPPLASPKGPELIRVYQVGPRMRDDEVYQYFQPISCMHCLDAPCIKACPCSAIYKDTETGITLVNQDECIGCKSCLWVCPYGAPQFYDGKLVLCDLCIHRLAEGRPTACEAACPARAIHVGTTDAISTLAGKKAAERVGK
jgi:anaerobic dimethyl sulfoxide reductase subunit B (iron-sulfur subunit)